MGSCHTVTISDLEDVLARYWGYTTFRPLQRDAMDAVLQGRDSLLVLPTGGGKSLCFQAPAMVPVDSAQGRRPRLAVVHESLKPFEQNARCGKGRERRRQGRRRAFGKPSGGR